MFFIQFNVNGSKSYLGRGWAPVAKKASAVKFQTREGAEERLNSVKEIMASPANQGLWIAAHIHTAVIVS